MRDNNFDWQRIAGIIRWMGIVDTRDDHRYRACASPANTRENDRQPLPEHFLYPLVLDAINHPGAPERCPHCFSDEVARFRMPASLRRTCHCCRCDSTYETPL
jgi:hypothetical protein